jgi:hypothetical protein
MAVTQTTVWRKTIAKGESLLRNGYTGWLLLKKGDTATDTLGYKGSASVTITTLK